MSYKKIPVFVMMLLVILQLSVFADFKKDEPVMLENADGSRVEAYITGDEYVQVLHDSDGYVLVKTDSGNFEYAKMEDGELVPCGNKKGIKYAELGEEYFILQREKVYAVMESAGVVVPGSTPRLFSATDDVKEFKGNGTVIVVPIAFSGGSGDFAGVTQSVQNACEYFSEVSYGMLSLGYFDASENMDVFISEHPEEYYHPYGIANKNGYLGDKQRLAREKDLVTSAIKYYGLSQKSIDSPIDVNGDGENDFLVFVYNSELDTGWSELLWPHQIEYESPQFRILGKNVSRWIFVTRAESDETLCHEMYHAIGAPDLYGYSDQYSYMGMWDIMDSGNGSMLTYMKYHYGGWIDEMPEITKAGTYTLNPASESEGNCYKIPINENEYYVVEYRNRYSGKINYLDNWRQWHNEGLLITRVNSSRTGEGNVEADTEGAEIELVSHPVLGVNSILGAILPEFSPGSGFDRSLASGGTDDRTVIKNIRENPDGTLSFDLSFDGTTMQAYKALDGFKIVPEFEYKSDDVYYKLTAAKETVRADGTTVYTKANGYEIKYVYLIGRVTSANSYGYMDYTEPFKLNASGILLAYLTDANGVRVGELCFKNVIVSLPGINTAKGLSEWEYDVVELGGGVNERITAFSFENGEQYVGKLNMDDVIKFTVDGAEYEYLSEDIRGKTLLFDASNVSVKAGDGSEVYMNGLYKADYAKNKTVVLSSENGRSSLFEYAETITADDEISLGVLGGFSGEILYKNGEEWKLYTSPLEIKEDTHLSVASFEDGELVKQTDFNIYVQGDYREYSADELNRIFKNSGSSFLGGAGKYVKVCYTKGEGTLVLRNGDWLELCKIVNPRDDGVIYIDAEDEIFVQEASGDVFTVSVVDESCGVDLTVLKNADSGRMVAVHGFDADGDFEVIVSEFSGERFMGATKNALSLARGKTQYLPFTKSDSTIKAFCFESLEKLEPKGRVAVK